MISRDDETAMIQEIRQQGEVLARVREKAQRDLPGLVGQDPLKRLHLVGCGDMFFAAAQVKALAGLLWGTDVSAWRSMDFRWQWARLSGEDLVICASVSGRTPRTLEAAILARQAGARVLGITDNPGSPLDRELEQTLILGTAPPELLEQNAYAGYRSIIAQTQTFTAVLLVELMLAAGDRAGVECDKIPDRVNRLVEVLDEPARRLAEPFFSGGRQVVVLGSGPHLAAARYGAAKMLEFAIPATAQCIEEFNHQEVFVADSQTRVVLLAAGGEAQSRAAELTEAWERLGVRSLVLGAEDLLPGKFTQGLAVPCGGLLDAVLGEVVALQLLTAWGVAAMGRDPDRWLGGRRAEQVQEMSQHTIRGSQLWQPPAHMRPTRPLK